MEQIQAERHSLSIRLCPRVTCVLLMFPVNLASAVCLICLSLVLPAFAADGEVTIPDPHLEAALREQLEKPVGPLTSNDLASLGSFFVGPKGITNLTGLEAATGADYIGLIGNDFSDISPLLGLPQLNYLELHGNRVTNFTGIAALHGLYYLSIQLRTDANIQADLSGISGSTVRQLNVSFNPSYSLTFSNLPYLERLSAAECGLTNADFVTNFAKVRALNLEVNNLVDIKPLSKLTNLTEVHLTGNSIGDITPLESLPMTNLVTVGIERNAIDLNRESPSRKSIERLLAAKVDVYFNGQRYSPRLRIVRNGAGDVGLEFDGDAWARYRVETSIDLQNWSAAGAEYWGLELLPTRIPLETVSSSNTFFRLVRTFSY